MFIKVIGRIKSDDFVKCERRFTNSVTMTMAILLKSYLT